MTHQCPICQTPYTEYQDNTCAGCNWDLTPYPLSLNSIPDEFLEKEQKKIAWAKQIWQKLLQQQQEERKLTEQLLEAQKRPSVDVVELLSGLQKELAHIRQEKEALKSRWEEVQQQRSQLQKQNEQLQQQVTTLQQQVVSLQEKLKTSSPPPPSTPSPGKEETVSFTVVKLDEQGKITQRQTKENRLHREDLGGGISLEMVYIPAGKYWRGSPDTEAERSTNEGPRQEVEIKEFWMGRYTITQAQWYAVAGLPQVNKSLTPDPSYLKGKNLPVEQVSWQDTQEFLERLCRRTGKKYSLPSEAQWEYACRAGTTTPFHFGPTITTEVANYDGNYTYGKGPKGQYKKTTTLVGSFNVANDFGLYDMHGNVWEWCADPWHDNYRGAPRDGSVWREGGNSSLCVVQGGSWVYNPNNCRAARRAAATPGNRVTAIGFRVVLVG